MILLAMWMFYYSYNGIATYFFIFGKERLEVDFDISWPLLFMFMSLDIICSFYLSIYSIFLLRWYYFALYMFGLIGLKA